MSRRIDPNIPANPPFSRHWDFVIVPDYYILDDDHDTRPVTAEIWREWFADGDRAEDPALFTRVAETHILTGTPNNPRASIRVVVATTFLGVDRQRRSVGHPLLFQTSVSGWPDGRRDFLSSTWIEAVAQHEQAVRIVKPYYEMLADDFDQHRREELFG